MFLGILSKVYLSKTYLCCHIFFQMIIVRTINELNEQLNKVRSSGLMTGFVPTMGALHPGHISLITKARKESDFVISSIFVNPTQFNNPEDLKHYPRTESKDVEMLQDAHTDLVFIPYVAEIYPEPDKRVFDFGNLEKVMEGSFRPGHFNGVAQVVSRLFDIVRPNKAFFGEKDFQQLAIIKQMVEQLKMNVEIVPCPIMREPDGLAMSSRNMRLNQEERKNAALISKVLFESKNKFKHLTVDETKEFVIRTINENPFLKVEYFEISEIKTLQPITTWGEDGSQIGCIAVIVGPVRLIDNIIF